MTKIVHATDEQKMLGALQIAELGRSIVSGAPTYLHSPHAVMAYAERIVELAEGLAAGVVIVNTATVAGKKLVESGAAA